MQALPHPSRVSFSRARFLLCPLLPSACYAGYFRYYWGQLKAGTGHKIQFVPFVFSKSRFQGPVFRCDKTVVIASLLEAIESIPDKDYNFWGNENFHNIYERILHERKRKSGYLERRRIYKRPLHLRVDLFSRIKANIFQSYLYINLL